MPPELLALAAAICFASASVAVQLASSSGSAFVGFLTGLGVTVVALLGLAVVTVDRWTIDPVAAVLFALGGLLGSGLGRALNLLGVRAAGASVAVPLQSSAAPLVATAAGVGLFHERVGPGRMLAIGLILVGIWLCTRGGSANHRTSETDLVRRRAATVVLIPLAAGAAFAGGDLLRKTALVHGGTPYLGALIGTTAGLVMWLALGTVVPSLRRTLRSGRPSAWYVLYGTLAGAAQILVLLALRTGDLSTVSPVLSSQPVIILVLSALLLRRFERLTWTTSFGAVVVALGVGLIATT